MLPEDKEMNDKVDVIVLEADRKINQEDGYGFLIKKRLSEYKIQAEITICFHGSRYTSLSVLTCFYCQLLSLPF